MAGGRDVVVVAAARTPRLLRFRLWVFGRAVRVAAALTGLRVVEVVPDIAEGS